MLLTVVLISRSIIIYLYLILFTLFLIKDKDVCLTFVNKITIVLVLLLSVNTIISYKENIFISLVPIITITMLREVFVIIYESKKKVIEYFDKDPVFLVQNSIINFKNIISNKYTVEKLFNELRKRNIYSLKDAKYVILYEDRLIVLNDINNKGQIYPEPLILNSKINTRILSSINMNKNFLFKILKNENLNLEDIYFATYKNKKLYIIKKEKLN